MKSVAIMNIIEGQQRKCKFHIKGYLIHPKYTYIYIYIHHDMRRLDLVKWSDMNNVTDR